MKSPAQEKIVRSYRECIRTAMLRILAVGSNVLPTEELDQIYSKLLHGDGIKEAAIMELTNADIKNDQHYFILLSLMHDLCKWCVDSQQIRNCLKQQSPLLGLSIVEFIVGRSVKLLKYDKKHYTLVTRQNELFRVLLQLLPLYFPICSYWQLKAPTAASSDISLATFIELYNIIKEPKDYHPTNVREDQKRMTLKIVDQTLHTIVIAIKEAQSSEDPDFISITYRECSNLLQFLYESASFEIYKHLLNSTEPSANELILSRFRIVKGIIDTISLIQDLLRECTIHSSSHELLHETSRLRYNPVILHGSAHLLIESTASRFLSNLHLVGICFNIYEQLMQLLVQRQSMIPLYLFTNVVVNNLKKLMGDGDKDATLSTGMGNPYQQIVGRYVILETILEQMSQLFQNNFLGYFLKLYDWNFMEEDICLETVKILYEFIQDSKNQKKPEYELYKKHLVLINRGIEQFLTRFQTTKGEAKQQGFVKERKQFYELKKKQYFQLVEQINNIPKQIFKTIDALESKTGSEQAKEQFMQKCVRILNKSKHVQPQSMINIVSSGNKISDLILERYLDALMKRVENISLEEFIRLLICNFFLWGEAQQIQRVLDKLTLYYYSHNPVSAAVFQNSDVVYTFANAIIILNTDQHNPKNESKMTEEDFLKMCRKINNNRDLPEEIVKRTYQNIRQSQIYTYRNRYQLKGISLRNWMVMVSDYSSVNVGYYDQDMAEMEVSEGAHDGEDSTMNGFAAYAYELLMAVIDEKETQKLQLMVERFQYDEKKFDCEIIEKIRVMVGSKPHMAMHMLQKIFEVAGFESKKKVDDKMLSYYWLGANVIENFSSHIPFSKISEFLLLTWRVRFQLRDTLYIRENSDLNKIKTMIKEYKRRESKKSIMDMFSKFLGSKDSEEEEQCYSPVQNIKQRGQLMNYSVEVLKILLKNQQGRARAAESIFLSLRHEEAKRFEQFVACLHLIFYLTNGQNGTTRDDCAEICSSLLEEVFGIVQSQISKRLSNLKTKSLPKYEQLIGLCQYWAMKVLLNWKVAAHSCATRHAMNGRLDVNISLILTKCQDFIPQCSRQVIMEIVGILQLRKSIPLKSLEIPGQFLKCLGDCAKASEIECEGFNSSDGVAMVKTSQASEITEIVDVKTDKTQLPKDQTLQKVEQTQQPVEQDIQQTKKEPIQQKNEEQKPQMIPTPTETEKEEDIEQSIKRELGIYDQKQPEPTEEPQSEPIEEPQSEPTEQLQPEPTEEPPATKKQAEQGKGESEYENMSNKSNNSGVSQNGEDVGFPVYML